jgi:hypothetical protein
MQAILQQRNLMGARRASATLTVDIGFLVRRFATGFTCAKWASGTRHEVTSCGTSHARDWVSISREGAVKFRPHGRPARAPSRIQPGNDPRDQRRAKLKPNPNLNIIMAFQITEISKVKTLGSTSYERSPQSTTEKNPTKNSSQSQMTFSDIQIENKNLPLPGMFARKLTRQLRQEQRDLQLWLEKETERQQLESDLKHKREIERRMHPRTVEDFQILYKELETWRLKETKRIKEGIGECDIEN